MAMPTRIRKWMLNVCLSGLVLRNRSQLVYTFWEWKLTFPFSSRCFQEKIDEAFEKATNAVGSAIGAAINEAKDLASGIDGKDLASGIDGKDLASGITGLASGIDAKDLLSGIPAKDLASATQSKGEISKGTLKF